MALADILRAMEAAAAAEEAQVLAAARTEADTLLATAHQTAAAARERLQAEAAAEARTARARLESEAALQIAERRARVRDALVQRAFTRAGETLAEVRTMNDYSRVLQSLLREGLSEFSPGESLVVRCDARDLPVLTDLVREQHCHVALDGSLVCWGGVVVQDAAGCVVADNTLERRLERAREALWPRVAALMRPATPALSAREAPAAAGPGGSRDATAAVGGTIGDW